MSMIVINMMQNINISNI